MDEGPRSDLKLSDGLRRKVALTTPTPSPVTFSRGRYSNVERKCQSRQVKYLSWSDDIQTLRRDGIFIPPIKKSESNQR